METWNYAAIERRYPPRPDDGLREAIAALFEAHNLRMVVLDDDPTGIQTVHGNFLLTDWERDNLAAALADPVPFFYLLTNTRAMDATGAEQTVRQAMNAVLDANADFGYRLIFVSRSDSTLRGHFPLEPEAMRQELLRRGIPVTLPTVFAPAFFEAGRYTVDGVQTLREGDRLIPVSRTEFARDNVFGYTRADLVGYIVEKSDGRVSAEDIFPLSIDRLREDSGEALEALIARSGSKAYLTLDAVDYGDLRAFAHAFLQVVVARSGESAVLRTSSSLPKALSGIAEQSLLDARMSGRGRDGLFVIGSHVKKSTEQLARLLGTPGVAGVEVDVLRVLAQPEALRRETTERLEAIHRSGGIPALYTSRQEVRSDDPARRQELGQKVSDFLVDVVRHLPFAPAWLVAKGGITSHDILTRGLGIRRARVLGQVLPGVPTLVTGPENRFPAMPYIIFPGNVGSENSLAELCLMLAAVK